MYPAHVFQEGGLVQVKDFLPEALAEDVGWKDGRVDPSRKLPLWLAGKHTYKKEPP